MTQPDAFGRDYLRLALSIDRHFPGYVDAYYGPSEIKEAVNSAELPSTPVLRELVSQLQASVPDGDPARSRYLQVTLDSMTCMLDLIDGIEVDYVDEVRRLYNVHPEPVSEDAFLEAHNMLDNALPPGPSLTERMNQHRQLFEIDPEDALSLIDLAQAETRNRTTGLVSLPDDESVEVRLTSNQPWGAYNWYLGSGRSLIEFNTDIPLSGAALLGTFAHEGYPGHHTEALLKEEALYNQRGYAEQSAMILLSPAAVIAEGIATTALEMIFPEGSGYAWTRDVLLPAAGLNGAAREATEQSQAIGNALRQLRYVTGNAAIFYHSGRLSRANKRLTTSRPTV
ncbi:MAG: hypothetical protein R3C44_08145 [Chloroflexota bacterium]